MVNDTQEAPKLPDIDDLVDSEPETTEEPEQPEVPEELPSVEDAFGVEVVEASQASKPLTLASVADSIQKLGDQTLMSVDDFDEGNLGGEPRPPQGFPKTIRDSRGNEVDAEMGWATYDSITNHPWVMDGIAMPVTRSNCPDIPDSFFDAKGFIRRGSDVMLIASKPLRERYEKANKEQGIDRRVHSMGQTAGVEENLNVINPEPKVP